MELLFVEVQPVTRKIEWGLEDEFRRLQDRLRNNPTAGALDPGTCGLRKIRMADFARQRGKSSGPRVHYLYVPHRSTIYIVSIYSKDEQSTLTPQQKKSLCAWILRMAVSQE